VKPQDDHLKTFSRQLDQTLSQDCKGGDSLEGNRPQAKQRKVAVVWRDQIFGAS